MTDAVQPAAGGIGDSFHQFPAVFNRNDGGGIFGVPFSGKGWGIIQKLVF